MTLRSAHQNSVEVVDCKFRVRSSRHAAVPCEAFDVELVELKQRKSNQTKNKRGCVRWMFRHDRVDQVEVIDVKYKNLAYQ